MVVCLAASSVEKRAGQLVGRMAVLTVVKRAVVSAVRLVGQWADAMVAQSVVERVVKTVAQKAVLRAVMLAVEKADWSAEK